MIIITTTIIVIITIITMIVNNTKLKTPTYDVNKSVLILV